MNPLDFPVLLGMVSPSSYYKALYLSDLLISPVGQKLRQKVKGK